MATNGMRIEVTIVSPTWRGSREVPWSRRSAKLAVRPSQKASPTSATPAALAIEPRMLLEEQRIEEDLAVLADAVHPAAHGPHRMIDDRLLRAHHRAPAHEAELQV